ncbi:hypothetical protein [Agromyces sp. M3QZ16-3]|uniref:hypothetical protein n=1 Tax=Agromyces sp. M3QZ16-3 TaxID=3447585 RepID=UPI003F68DEBF
MSLAESSRPRPRAADDAFWSDVDRHLVRYGASFTPEVIVRAEGSWVETEDGRRLLG